MSLPSLRRRLIMALGGAGVVLLILLSGLMLVAEDKMEELSLRHWLEAEATRYGDDWLRLGPGAPAPSPRQFSSYWTEAGRLPRLTVAGAADPRVIVLADVTLVCLHAKGRARPSAD